MFKLNSPLIAPAISFQPKNTLSIALYKVRSLYDNIHIHTANYDASIYVYILCGLLCTIYTCDRLLYVYIYINTRNLSPIAPSTHMLTLMLTCDSPSLSISRTYNCN